ncbi:transglutaminase-like domain-containing protein, partial [Anaerostipes caccae]
MRIKKDYCTQYASAAVMMFRSAGIPSRYVEG